MNLIHKAKTAVRLIAQPLADARERKIRAPLYSALHTNCDPGLHLRESAEWLGRAQDHGEDRGFSYGTVFGDGFRASYPETTGYIICTFLDLATFYGADEYRRRAIEAGDWESKIRMPSGAVMGGIHNGNPTPAMFNTGMVLLGWAALHHHTGADRFATSGRRAGKWLFECQEPDGNWIRGNSQFANSRSTVHNVKAAWELAEMGFAIGERAFIDAAVKNAEFAVSRQASNGWFADCCLSDADRPLLHTIAYTMQGLIGIGRIANRPDLIDAAQRAAKPLKHLMDVQGFIPGRIDRSFNGSAEWCCLTGSAQTSVVWTELERVKGNSSYGSAADVVNQYLMARHDVSSPDPSIRGGLAGSWPVWGQYGQYQILNWATTFFADALLMRMQADAGHAGAGRR
jgi:hypothetical protein